MFSVHMSLITGACALIHALQARWGVRLGTAALPSAGRVWLDVKVPMSHVWHSPEQSYPTRITPTPISWIWDVLGCRGFTWDGHMLWMNTPSCHCARVSRTLAPIQRGGSPGQGALLHKCLQYLAFSRSLLLQIKILGMKTVISTTESGTLQSFRN